MIPAGLTARAAQLEDAAGIAELITAFDVTMGVEGGTSADDVRAFWTDVDLERDSRLIETGDERFVAYVELTMRGAAPFFDGYVHPDWLGQGLGRELVRFSQQVAAGRAERVRTGILTSDEAAAGLVLSEGFRPVRSFYRMTIDLESAPPEPTVSPGIVLRPFEAADAEGFHAALEESFMDHWDHEPEPFEDWRRRTIEADDFDPALWLLAADDGEVAGILRGTGKRFGSGWINTLGVRRDWRRRGLGVALLHASFGEFWRRGERRVQLGVDAGSETGAVDLYERVGMRIEWRADIYEKELT